MASVTLPPGLLTQASGGRQHWPASAGARWALRFGLALPLIALAIWADRRGFASAYHETFVEQARAVAGGGALLGGLQFAYPPLPTLLATLVPGGTLGLSIVASLFAGLTLHLSWEQLVRQGFGAAVVAVLLLAAFAVPAVAFGATQSVAGIATLSLLAIALHGFIRFTMERDTEAGFLTGLALAAAYTFDPIAVLYALALGTATAFIGRDRFRDEPHAAAATAAVLVFPTVFALAAWSFLEWRFTSRAMHTVATNPDILAFPGGAWPSLLAALTTVGAALLHVPLFLAVGLLYAVHRPVALVGYLMWVPASVVAVWIGLRYPPATAYLLFTLVAIGSMPRREGRSFQIVMVVVALAQLGLAWVWPPTSPGFAEWLEAVI